MNRETFKLPHFNSTAEIIIFAREKCNDIADWYALFDILRLHGVLMPAEATNVNIEMLNWFDNQ